MIVAMSTIVSVVFFILLSFVRNGRTDMFTGMVEMQKALHAERIVAEELRQYISKERERINTLEK